MNRRELLGLAVLAPAVYVASKVKVDKVAPKVKPKVDEAYKSLYEKNAEDFFNTYSKDDMHL